MAKYNPQAIENDRELIRKYGQNLYGIDEVGRGSLAGPLLGCIVKLKQEFYDNTDYYLHNNSLLKEINDSKTVSKWKHKKVAVRMLSTIVDDFAVCSISSRQIDSVGIGESNKLLVKDLVNRALVKPDFIINDCVMGLGQLNYFGEVIRNHNVPKADSDYFCVSCASILAKCIRDTLMKEHELSKLYDWEHNSGYGTYSHIKILQKYGPSEMHRKTFMKKLDLSLQYSEI